MIGKQIDKGNIGDFSTNQLLEWTPISFTVEFIFQMRKTQKKLLNVPSTRQAVAIPKLLTAMYYRKVTLVPEDFIKAAVITTPIEDQEVARQIAFDIIFPKKVEPKTKGSAKAGTPSTKAILQDKDDSDKIDFMDELLSEFVDSGLDLDNLDMENIVDQTLKDFSNLMDFINDLYDRAARGEEPYQSLIDILEQRNGYSDILGKNLNSLQMLKDYLQQTIMREVNTISPKDIISSVKLGWGSNIIKQSTVPWIKSTTQYCMNDPNFQQTLSDIMKNEDVGTAARTARYLKEAGLDSSAAKNLANNLVQRAKDLLDIMEISSVLEYIPQFDHKKTMTNSLNKDMGGAFNITRTMDQMFNTSLTNDLFNQWSKNNSTPTLPEIFQAQTDITQWQKMLDQCVQDQLNDIQSKKGQAAYNMADLSMQLMQLSSQAVFDSCSKRFQKNAGIAGMKSLEAATTPEIFENCLRSLVSQHVSLDKNEVVKLGIKVGLPEPTILEILGGNYELLKSMIANKLGNFQRYTSIMKNIGNLTGIQIQELMQSALSNGNLQAMGALGHHNLGQAFSKAQQFGEHAQQKLAESLTAGPGDNLLIQWFMSRKQIPSKMKSFVRNLVKDALIKIALNMISNQRGSGEKGLIPTNKLRIFIEGDDMDLIDIDASIENIVMQGKSLDMIMSEDLMVAETEKGRVSICFMLDISGSMGGMKLAACSIAVMVLIGSLRADEVAICFFESNTHVVKKFGDEKNLEDVADELLDLHARGGTRVQAALNWGAKQLEETTTEMKICFLLTDCQFFEKEQEIKKELQSYVNQKVKFMLGVNTRSYSKRYAKWILDTTKGEIVYILKIMDIPKILTEALEKIG